MVHVKMWDDAITFEVEGRGEFPFDMLRHSMAWPETSEDAGKLVADGRRRIRLTAHKARYVNTARWESFCWKFIDGDMFPYGQAADQGIIAKPERDPVDTPDMRHNSDSDFDEEPEDHRDVALDRQGYSF